MIDVTVQPIGRSLLAIGLGAVKYKAMIQQRQIAEYKKQVAQLNELQERSAMMNELTFDITSSMIDKRFTSSKQYIATRGQTSDFALKKSLTKEDRKILKLANQNAMQSRVRYNKSVSQYNKWIHDQKMKSNLRAIDIQKYT